MAPIAHLTKSEVRGLATYLGIPPRIIAKPPSAGLWPGQTDEDEMGVTYEKIDAFILQGTTEEPYLSRIKAMATRSEHKQRLPLTLLSP